MFNGETFKLSEDSGVNTLTLDNARGITVLMEIAINEWYITSDPILVIFV